MIFSILNMHLWGYVIAGWVATYAVIALWFYMSREPIEVHNFVAEKDKSDLPADQGRISSE